MTASTSTAPVTATTANIGETITEIRFLQDLPIGGRVLYVGTLRGFGPRVYEKVDDSNMQRMDQHDEGGPTPISAFMMSVRSGRMHKWVDTEEWAVGRSVSDRAEDLRRLPVGARFRNPSGTEWEVTRQDPWRAHMLYDGVLSSTERVDGRPADSFTEEAGFTITALPRRFRVGQRITQKVELVALPVGTHVKNPRSGTEWEIVELLPGGKHTRRLQGGLTCHVDSFGITELEITALPVDWNGGEGSVDTEPNPNVEAAAAQQELIDSQRARIEQLEREHEEFKRKVADTAMRFAEENDLCGEVERCLDEMGLERPSRTYRFMVTQTFMVRADITTTGSDRVPDEDFIVRSLSSASEPVSLDSDWENVDVDPYGDAQFSVTNIEREDRS